MRGARGAGSFAGIAVARRAGYLLNSPKFEYGEIDDPRSKGLEITRSTKEEIKSRVQKMKAQATVLYRKIKISTGRMFRCIHSGRIL